MIWPSLIVLFKDLYINISSRGYDILVSKNAIKLNLKLEIMLRWTVTFVILAIIAAIFGFGGIAAGAASIAKILFFIFLILFVISLISGRRKV